VINTHWHFDHTDGNEWLHSEGAVITAHQNTQKRLSTRTRVAEWNFSFHPSPLGALPTDVVKKQKTLKFNGESVELDWFGPSHTDSDLAVHFTNADVYLTGDTWWNGLYPFIDYSTGGSIDGMIRATKQSLATSPVKP
jgi:glyoxylase-like metal-dependent hydrolase (beta-lactamase superfamily II)